MKLCSMPAQPFAPDVLEQLVRAISRLSQARTLDEVVAIVRAAGRGLLGADGATFILRDGDLCHYVDEDAIAPLWKGQRFAMQQCISGWVMLNGKAATVPDIRKDHRIPIAAYRPTFVKSLAMVPIRKTAPIGAIGAYWASLHVASEAQMRMLQILADSVSVAMENVELLSSLERRVCERTRDLEIANQDLSAFAISLTHDLRGELMKIDGWSRLLERRQAGQRTTPVVDEGLTAIRDSVRAIGQQIDSTLSLYNLTQRDITRAAVNLSEVAQDVVANLRARPGAERRVEWLIAEQIVATGDHALLRVLVENLLTNAWKYSARRDPARVHFDCARTADGECVFFVKDNGAGFDAARASDLFKPFSRLHSPEHFEGHGIGLASAHRIVRKHGGRIWAEGEPDRGATFSFTLPD